LAIYQIQTKYRDEARSRGGLLRGREFVMKDSYSFDIDDAGLERSYEAHRAAYIKTFERLGLDFVIVSAMSGAMGGSRSEEFLHPSPVGEDTFVRCSSCDYAANTEAVTTPVPPAISSDGAGPAHVEDTPDTPTIDTLVAVANERFPRPDRAWTAADTLKNVVVTLVHPRDGEHPEGSREPLVIGLPGDREVDTKRLEASVAPAEVDAFTEADFARCPGLVKGYIGPAALGTGSTTGIRYLLDPRVVDGTAWITGANEKGRHVFNLIAGRDFSSDGTVEAANVVEGDPCPRCQGGTLSLARGMEIGHIFQLGRKYAEALGLQVLDQNGKLVTVTMGSYGIGVSRAMAAIAEATYDEKGLCWPREVAPADVHVVATGKDPVVFETAERLCAELESAGVRLLFDDRPKVSPGIKFKDAELIGVPTLLIIGKGLQNGTVEIRDRRTGETEEIGVDEAVKRLGALVQS
jgi:prolyl-tRNA synthetase